jgi:vibriolysin
LEVNNIYGKYSMVKNNKLAVVTLFAALVHSSGALAAQRINLTEQHGISAIVDSQQLLTQQGENQYTSTYSSENISGKQRVKYQQFFQGIPIFGESVVATANDQGQYSELSGHYIANISKDIKSTVPNVSVEVAKRSALGLNALSVDSQQVSQHSSKLYVWLTADEKAHLVWLISYMHDGVTPSKPHVIVDAHTGTVLDHWDGLNHVEATGPGGNLRTGRYQFGQGKRYPAFEVTESNGICQLDSASVVTYDMNHQTTGGRVHKFSCYENNSREVNGSYSALNDAHAFGQISFEMYEDWFNTAPISQKLKLRVHYGRAYEGAFWDGQQMTFGDGATAYHNMVALDVVAHEVSHGFTQQNSDLVYRNQSGGLNESFSDIAAAAAIYYAEGDYNWLIGDRIKKNSGARRYMNNPIQDGVSIDHVSQYRDGMDVHHSSGIYNKAFYLLATKDDWNIKKAFEVMVKANRLYWNANATFDSAGADVYRAAKDLGYCVDDIIDALSEVGINNVGGRTGQFCVIIEPPPIYAEFDYASDFLSVNFTNKTSLELGIVSNYWAFGDGRTSSMEHPTHTYAQSGSYNVSLTVINNAGETNSTAKVITVVNSSDSCDIALWDPLANYEIGVEVKHNDTIYQSTWWSHGADPEVFSNVWSKKTTCPSDPYDKIQAKFSYVNTGWLVNFTSESTSDKEIIDYDWDFGDNSDGSFFGKTAIRLYEQDGTYIVTLKVTDVDGNTSSSHQQVSVILGNPAPVADFTYIVENLTVNLVSSSTDNGEIETTQWQFGDGSMASGEIQSHTYSLAGEYLITIKVTDDQGTSTEKSMLIIVGQVDNNKAPVAKFAYALNLFQVKFTDLSTDDHGVVSYSWNFGDSNSSEEQHPNHNYGVAGSYQVQLTVNDEQGQSNTTSQTITLKNDDVCNVIAWNASTVYWGDDQASKNGNIYQAKWYTKNEDPIDNSGQWEVWKLMGNCN